MATTTRNANGSTGRGKASSAGNRASASNNGGSTGRRSAGSSSSTSRNQGPRRPRDSEGRFTSNSWIDAARERPYTTAAVAAGVAGVSAFLWSRRGQIGELASTGYDRVSELTSDRFGSSDDNRSQREIAEEALSLKETGDPLIDDQIETGAVAY